MPDDPKKLTRTQLWNLYGKARKLNRDGKSPEEIDRYLREGAGIGLNKVMQELGIGTDEELMSRKDRLRGSISSIMQGMTANYSDEIGATVAGLLPNGLDKEGYRARQNELQADFGEQFPGSNVVGQLSGAAVPAIATAGVLGGMGAANSALAGEHLLARSLASMGTGVIGGGLAGAAYESGAAEPGQRIPAAQQGGAVGMGVGGAMGVLAPGVGAALGRYAPAVLDAVPFGAGRPAARWMRSNSPAAARMARQEIDASMRRTSGNPAMTSKEIAERIAATPEGMLVMDADQALAAQAGYAVKRNPSDLAQTGGPARTAAARFQGQNRRISRAIREGADFPVRRDSPSQVFKAQEELWVNKIKNPVMAEHGQSQVGSTQLGSLIKAHPVLKKIIPTVTNADGTTITLAKNPVNQRMTVEQAWNLRRRLGRLKDAAYSGDLTYNPEHLKAAMDGFDELAEQMHPGLGEVLQGYAEIQMQRRARELGRKLATKPPDDIRAALNAAKSPEEAAFIREGIVDKLESKLNLTGTGGATAKRLMDVDSDDLMKLRLLYPEGRAGDQGFQALLDYLAKEQLISNSTQEIGRVINMPIPGERGMTVGYITTRRAMQNDLLSQALEDPALEGMAAKRVGQVLMGGGEEASAEYGMLERQGDQSARSMVARGRLSGVLGSEILPDQQTRPLLPYQRDRDR
jgi:hypothetical protein